MFLVPCGVLVIVEREAVGVLGIVKHIQHVEEQQDRCQSLLALLQIGVLVFGGLPTD